MQTLDNVPRIKTPSPDVFWQEFVVPRRPVILTDLYDGQPIRRIDSIGKALATLGGMQVMVNEEYTKGFLEGLGFGPGAAEASTLAEYVQYRETHPGSPRIVVEYPSPPELRALYEVSPICKPPLGRQFTFVASEGNCAHLHYDWEPTHNLMYQVCGNKRFMLIPAEASNKVMPLFHVGTVLLENFSPADKLAFMKYAGGYDCVLAPTEALFMPLGIWHHVEYLDTSLSYTVRFGEEPTFKRLFEALGAQMSFHRNLYTQNIAVALVKDPTNPRITKVVDDLIRSVGEVMDAPLERYKRIEALIREAYDAIEPESAAFSRYHYYPSDEAAEKIVRGFLKEMGALT